MEEIKNIAAPSTPNAIHHIFLDGCLLAPGSFLDKRMNISAQALINYLKLLQSALSNFLEGKLHLHDALVGENACHIRALVLVDLSKKLKSTHFHQSLKKMISQLEQIIFTIPHLPVNKEDEEKTIRNYLQSHHLIFNVPGIYFQDIHFIFNSYLLTLTKESSDNGFTLQEKTSHQPIIELGLVRNKVKSLIKNSQKSLSQLSCDYLQSEAKSLSNSIYTKLLRVEQDDHERCFVPQFFAAKVILKKILNQKHPLVIKVKRYWKNNFLDEVNLFFKSNANQTDFAYWKNPSKKTNYGVIAAGVVSYEQKPETKHAYIKRLLSYSIMDLLLANFASHPQYAGALKDRVIPFGEIKHHLEKQITLTNNKYQKKMTSQQLNLLQEEKNDFFTKKSFAILTGCALENPSLLFLNHVYADNISRHLAYNLEFLKNNLLSHQNIYFNSPTILPVT